MIRLGTCGKWHIKRVQGKKNKKNIIISHLGCKIIGWTRLQPVVLDLKPLAFSS